MLNLRNTNLSVVNIMRAFYKKRIDLNGVEFKKLTCIRAKYLHEKAKDLQAKQTPRNSSLNHTLISLSVEGEINNFRERKELVDKKLRKELQKLNNPLWKSDKTSLRTRPPSYTFRNGFKKIVRQSKTPSSKFHQPFPSLLSSQSISNI